MSYEQKRAQKAGWTGDLSDDCFLRRGDFLAHVEQMGRGHWWFCISDVNAPGARDVYNSADCFHPLPLASGAKARCAAECMIDLLTYQRIAERAKRE